MKDKHILLVACPVLLLLGVYLGHPARLAEPDTTFVPDIPHTWDSTAIAEFLLPLADASVRMQPVSEDYYYGLPERIIYKSYLVYAAGQEPEGYLDSLRALEPVVLFDAATLKTEADWIRAGEAVFDYPYNQFPFEGRTEQIFTMMSAAMREAGAPVTPDGVLPFLRYVVTDQGLELGRFSCGMCHTKVLEDGTHLKGAQGNNPFDRMGAYMAQSRRKNMPASAEERATAGARQSARGLFKAPWIEHPSQRWLDSLTLDQNDAALAAIPPGVLARHGTHPQYPARIPDLRGIKDARYMDATGLMRHQNIGDLMRYAAFNENLDFLTAYDGFVPAGGGRFDGEAGLPPPDSVGMDRFSDEQLYALSLYLYSLEPLPSPHRYDEATLERGERVFAEQGCVTCHTPPHYTNNQLTPADGFTPPADHYERYDLFDVSVETDPGLALYTRRGTGYYKVPSLRGLWYRDMLLHDGSLTSLEELLDPARLRDDYVPSGFKRADRETHAVPGHPFGLELPDEDKAALIAFLNTL